MIVVCCPQMLRAITATQKEVDDGPVFAVEGLSVLARGMPEDPYQAVGKDDAFVLCPWCSWKPLEEMARGFKDSYQAEKLSGGAPR